MRYVRFFLCAVLTLASVLLAGTIFEKAEGKGTSVTWRTADETGVKFFLVSRREIRAGAPEGPWETVGGKIDAKGAGSSYSVDDVGVFKTADRVFEYRIEARNANDVSLEMISYKTSYLTSAAKRTWGSIKAMFR